MKSLIVILSALLLLPMSGCKDDATGTSGDPFGGGGGGGGVTFTIGTRQGQQGIIFTARPSAAATVNQITVSLPAQQFQEVIQGDGTTVFQAGTDYDVGEYTGVAAGQAWTFAFTGRIGNAQGTQYSVTSNFTMP